MKIDGSIVAWGANRSGQVGDGTTEQRLSPVPVSVFDASAPAVALAGGGTVGTVSLPVRLARDTAELHREYVAVGRSGLAGRHSAVALMTRPGHDAGRPVSNA